MVVGTGIIRLKLNDCRSLKAKRGVVRSFIAHLRNHFNASVAEVGANDVWHLAEVGFSMVGNNRQVINAKMDKFFNMAEDLGLAEIIDTDMEIINL